MLLSDDLNKLVVECERQNISAEAHKILTTLIQDYQSLRTRLRLESRRLEDTFARQGDRNVY